MPTLSPGLTRGFVFSGPSIQQDGRVYQYAPSRSDPFSDVTILSVTPVLKAFPEAYAERARAIEQEERHSRLDTPIFVCQLSFPGLPTVLHFFEPRYNYTSLGIHRLTPAVQISSDAPALFPKT
jgi:hypothetical protein